MGCTQRVLAYDGHDLMKYGVLRDALSDIILILFVGASGEKK